MVTEKPISKSHVSSKSSILKLCIAPGTGERKEILSHIELYQGKRSQNRHKITWLFSPECLVTNWSQTELSLSGGLDIFVILYPGALLFWLLPLGFHSVTAAHRLAFLCPQEFYVAPPILCLCLLICVYMCMCTRSCVYRYMWCACSCLHECTAMHVEARRKHLPSSPRHLRFACFCLLWGFTVVETGSLTDLECTEYC